MKKSKLNAPLTLFMFLALFFLGGCDDVQLRSTWQGTEISDNFTMLSWPEDGHYFDENSKVLLTVMNDTDNLYIRMMTRHQQTKMLILRAGFTLWLDTSGKSERTFGVQFPLANQKSMGGTSQDHKARTDFNEVLEDSQYNLVLLNGPGQTRQTMPTNKAQEFGIYSRLRMEKNYLIYELKVPLANAVEKGGVVSLGFESGKLERPSSGRGGQGGGRGGGKGGGRGGGGGKKMGGSKGAYGKSMPKPIEIWAKVHLVNGPEQ